MSEIYEMDNREERSIILPPSDSDVHFSQANWDHKINQYCVIHFLSLTEVHKTLSWAILFDGHKRHMLRVHELEQSYGFFYDCYS